MAVIYSLSYNFFRLGTQQQNCMITMGDQEGPFYESGKWTKKFDKNNNPILFYVGSKIQQTVFLCRIIDIYIIFLKIQLW